jgi:Fe(3+) dicitrate transport protein
VKHVIKSLAALLALGAVDVIAADGQSDDAFDKEFMEEVIVSGGKEGARTMSGSAYVLDEADLEQFDFSDLNKVLSTIPGVYIRQEDGFGLRPNIGLRGVTSERSQKNYADGGRHPDHAGTLLRSRGVLHAQCEPHEHG